MRRVDFEKKKEEFIDWCKKKWGLTKEKAAYIWDNYRYEILTFGPGVIAGIIWVVKYAAKEHQNKTNEDHRKRDIYDHSTGQWYHCKREMTNQEKLELERRLSEGEKKGQILRDMGLI